MGTMKKELISNALLYQLGWFSCMLLKSPVLGVILTVVALLFITNFKKSGLMKQFL